LRSNRIECSQHAASDRDSSVFRGLHAASRQQLQLAASALTDASGRVRRRRRTTARFLAMATVPAPPTARRIVRRTQQLARSGPLDEPKHRTPQAFGWLGKAHRLDLSGRLRRPIFFSPAPGAVRAGSGACCARAARACAAHGRVRVLLAVSLIPDTLRFARHLGREARTA
jgi:hypothetical protein